METSLPARTEDDPYVRQGKTSAAVGGGAHMATQLLVSLAPFL